MDQDQNNAPATGEEQGAAPVTNEGEEPTANPAAPAEEENGGGEENTGI